MKKITTLLLIILAMLVPTTASATATDQVIVTADSQETAPAVIDSIIAEEAPQAAGIDATTAATPVCATKGEQTSEITVDATTNADNIAESTPAVESKAKEQKESKKYKKKNIDNTLSEFEDCAENEKMGVEVKEKRQSDKFMDTDHVTKLLIAFFINFIAIMVVVRWLYYPKCKRGEFFFTYILIAISTFMLIYVLGDVKLKAGIALGLFAMFSIIRYRTEQIAIREMTYLFIIIALSAINGLTISELSIGEVLVINILFVATTWLCESKLFISHYSYKVIKYDNINLITPDKRKELIDDLKMRTGLNIIKVEVGAIDFLKDAAIVKMYYKSNEANNSVDTTLKAPTDEYKLK